jgi:DNA-binding Xre family transcriptional regulator
MNAISAVRTIMRNNKITIKELSEALGMSQHALQARLSHTRKSSLSLDNINVICQQLGYKMVIMPAAIRTNGYELDDGLEDPL